MRTFATVVLVCVAALGAGCSGRPSKLVWEGDGPSRATAVNDATSTLGEAAPGVRTGVWGEGVSATIQLLVTEVSERPHVHEHHDLTVVMLEGRGRLVVEDRIHELKEGDIVHISHGRPHHFHPTGPVVGLVIYTPRLTGRDYRELSMVR